VANVPHVDWGSSRRLQRQLLQAQTLLNSRNQIPCTSNVTATDLIRPRQPSSQKRPVRTSILGSKDLKTANIQTAESSIWIRVRSIRHAQFGPYFGSWNKSIISVECGRSIWALKPLPHLGKIGAVRGNAHRQPREYQATCHAQVSSLQNRKRKFAC
jgi:hypothetical protein